MYTIKYSIFQNTTPPQTFSQKCSNYFWGSYLKYLWRMACEVIFLASLYCFTFFVAVSLKLVICLVILYLLTTFVTVSCWKHFNCYHYIIIFVLMAIYHICIRWTVFYELLSSISNISLVLVVFLFTSDYLNSCFLGCFIGKLPLTWRFYISSTKWLCCIFYSELHSFTFLIIPLHMFPSKYFPFKDRDFFSGKPSSE